VAPSLPPVDFFAGEVFVDQATFQRWWELHLRVARGESLTSEERATYNAGLQELEKDEKLQEVRSTREVREQLRALEAERMNLEARRRVLESKIADLERRLHAETRHLLGVED
jgi:hypothetical protein